MILKKINKKQKQIQYPTCRNIQFLTHKKSMSIMRTLNTKSN